MSTAKTERSEAAKLPDDDVIGILLTQHARIRDLFAEMKTAKGNHKKAVFDELKALLAVHETAEELILRPVAQRIVGEAETRARNHEEEQATIVLAALERMDINSAEFDMQIAALEKSVIEHAEHEEEQEFPAVHRSCPEDELTAMGSRLLATEKIAPTHPHPSVAGSPVAQALVGPLASLVDRTKDALKAEGSGS